MVAITAEDDSTAAAAAAAAATAAANRDKEETAVVRPFLLFACSIKNMLVIYSLG